MGDATLKMMPKLASMLEKDKDVLVMWFKPEWFQTALLRRLFYGRNF